ncbi:MAG: ABC transporter permease [Planctomycetota bacterium]|nr:ABC transporter permease [Planctomycetota bacterium]
MSLALENPRQRPSNGPLNTLYSLYTGRHLLKALFLSELKNSARGATLHYFWWLLDPFLMMGVYTFVIDIVLQRGTPQYLLFLFCALLPWKAFSNSLNHSVSVMRNSQAVITRVPFPKMVLPASIVLSQLVYMSSGFLILIPLMLYYGVSPTAWILLLPLLMVLQALLTLGFCMFMAMFGAWFKDAGNFTSFLMQLWFFASPTLYTLDQVPEHLRLPLSFNPLVGLWNGYRAILMKGEAPDWTLLLITVAMTAAVLILSATLFGRLERQLAKVL